ncbi:MAG TPA: YesL family protein, partial [Candidatus Atribacteria bacterium]|nr:YesL family protein [Candidatus Atribacteria bacterium]
MLDGFFNRMYYGDPRKPDLKNENVKANRFKLFFTVLQVRFWQMIQLNLIYSVFWIPTIYLYFVLVTAVDNMKPEEFVAIIPTMLLILIPCLTIAGPATAGVSYVLRKWANDEHAWVWSDFKDALKENWKQGLMMMLLNGIFIFLFYTNIQFYSEMAD